MALLTAVITASAAPQFISELDCVRLSGTRDLVEAVASQVSVPRPCRSIVVNLAAPNDVIVVTRDGASSRRASTPAIAATIIESWAEVSMTADLLIGPPPGPKPVVAPTRAVTSEPTPTAGVEVGLSVRAEATVEEHSILGAGLMIRADTPLGITVPWLGGRFVIVPAAVAGSGTDGRRSMADLFAGVDVPFEVGDFVLAPGVAAGIGMVRTVRASPNLAGCTLALCAGLEGSVVNDGFSHASWGPRFEAGIRGMYPLNEQLGVDVGLTFSFLPLASASGSTPTYAAALPNATRAALALPAEGRFGARLGAGLRWGTW